MEEQLINLNKIINSQSEKINSLEKRIVSLEIQVSKTKELILQDSLFNRHPNTYY